MGRCYCYIANIEFGYVVGSQCVMEWYLIDSRSIVFILILMALFSLGDT